MESPGARLRGRGETSGGAPPFSLLQLQTALPLKRHGIRSVQPRLPAGNFGWCRALDATIAQDEQRKTQRLTMPVLRTCSASSGSSWTSNSTPSIASAARAIRARRRRFGTCRCVSESRCGPVRRVEVVQCLTSPPPSAPKPRRAREPPGAGPQLDLELPGLAIPWRGIVFHCGCRTGARPKMRRRSLRPERYGVPLAAPRPLVSRARSSRDAKRSVTGFWATVSVPRSSSPRLPMRALAMSVPSISRSAESTYLSTRRPTSFAAPAAAARRALSCSRPASR
jgi:hypothetical protein